MNDLHCVPNYSTWDASATSSRTLSGLALRGASPACGSRYSTAVDTRKLQELLLETEQKSFSLGNSTINNIIVSQRNVVIAQTQHDRTGGHYPLTVFRP